MIPVIPRPLPEELVKGNHFVLTDLLKSIPGNSSQAKPAQEPQAEITEGGLVSFVRPDQPPLVVKDPKLAPQAAKKKKVGLIKAADARLEGFMDLVDPIVSEPAEEMEDDMSSLAAGFVVRMRKRAASTQEETTLGSEVPGGKRPKRSGPNAETQKSPTIFTVNSPERASDALPASKGAA